MKFTDLQALAEEFSALLTGSRLQQLRQHGPSSFSLGFYSGVKQLLWLDFSRPQPTLYLRDKLPEAINPNGLLMALRKHLDGARLVQIEPVPDERILRWHFQTHETYQLITEFSGRHANLFLLDSAGHVLQQLYPDRSGRALQRSSLYRLPEPRPLPPQALSPITELPPDGRRSQAYAQSAQTLSEQTQQQTMIRQGLQGLAQRLKRAQSQLTRLQTDIDGLDEASLWQRRGELLQGAYGKVPRGASSVSVPDYYQPESPEIRIDLDPALDLAENIQRCFTRSRKRERAAERALDLLEGAEAEVEQLESLQRELTGLIQTAENLEPDVLARFQTLIPPPRAQTRKSDKSDTVRPYREFMSQAGQRIYVGRGAKDNDQLTFRVARGNDLWLHVRDYAGSHVIVPLNKNEQPHPQTLLDAATLALHYSQAAGPAEVSYTRRKHVQRFKGAKPGQVQLAEFKSLQLNPEPERLARLLQPDA